MNNDPIMVPLKELQEEQALVRQLVEQNKRLRETNSRLNRRCQRAESAARVTIEECRKAGISFARRLAMWAYEDLRRQLRVLGGAEESYDHQEKTRNG